VALGTQVANAEGTVTFTWTIPSGSTLGAHTVTLTGADSGSVTGTFQVVAHGLAVTGGEPGPALPAAALLLLIGSAILFSARSRRAKEIVE
jgi:LPXTG-motif cell wall-anchored protein